jgi:hypothetical protein
MLVVLVSHHSLISCCHGFLSGFDHGRVRIISSPSISSSLDAVSTRSGLSSDPDMVEMRADIARMKEEAIRRLDVLNAKFQEAELERQQNEPFNPVLFGADHADDPRVKELVDMAKDFETKMQHPQLTTDQEERKRGQQSSSDKKSTRSMTDLLGNVHTHPLKLIDGTRWRLMLNIGREPGTWMPKTWGVSGDRLYLNMEIEFTEDQLYEQDDFFNGVSGSKMLRIVHNEGTLSPSMREGGRRVRVCDGGYRVVPHEGPLGTTVLRFYFDLEEEIRHQGSDVYLPSGRVYCTCGYFPMAGRTGGHGGDSTKDSLQKELHELETQYQKLRNEMELEESLFSFDKLKRAKEIMDIGHQAKKIEKAIQDARIREPEKSLLRLSQDQSVGLSREGGVCCKKNKGVAVEYHILGHFEIASMNNREHADYRELLP